MANTETYSVIFNDGKNPDGTQRNHRALVWKEPTEGKAYKEGQMVFFGDQGQSSFAPGNEDGEIPHREPSSADEDLGITWHFAK